MPSKTGQYVTPASNTPSSIVALMLFAAQAQQQRPQVHDQSGGNPSSKLLLGSICTWLASLELFASLAATAQVCACQQQAYARAYESALRAVTHLIILSPPPPPPHPTLKGQPHPHGTAHQTALGETARAQQHAHKYNLAPAWHAIVSSQSAAPLCYAACCQQT